MKYGSFSIKNFRGIKDLTLDLVDRPGINVFTLVGLNESGKTTILEAIDFFQKGVEKAKSHTLIPKNRKRNFTAIISVGAKLVLDDADKARIRTFLEKDHGFCLEMDPKEIIITKQYHFKDSKFVEEKNLWDIEIIGKKKRAAKTTPFRRLTAKDGEWQAATAFIQNELLPPVIYYPNFLFEFPNRIYLEEYGGESEQQGFYRQVLQDILDSIDEGLDLDTHLLARLKSIKEEDIEALDSTLHAMGSKITQTVFKPWEALFKSTGKKKEIIIVKGKEERTLPEGQAEDRYYLGIKLRDGAEAYDIAERSLGFRWFFVFLLFTEFRKNRIDGKGEILFLLDEPASNLHSTAQEKLLETLKGLTDKSKLIYTTHSHHLISPEWLEGVFIVENRALDYDNELEFDTSKTDIAAELYRRFVTNSPNKQTYFQPILDKVEYKPSKLEQVPPIVVVEGKNDFYTLKYLNDIILGNPYPNLHFYPGGGAGKNDRTIRLYISWGLDFVVLMDSDTAGEAAKKKYITEIGNLVEGKIITLGDVSGTWAGSAMEELFTDTEKLRIIQALDPSAKVYSKVKFNNSMEHLLYLKAPAVISKGTTDKFIKVFEKLMELFTV